MLSEKRGGYNAQHVKGKQATLFVCDISGKQIFQTVKNVYDGYFTFDLNMKSYARGLYLVSLQTEKDVLVKKLVKQ